MVGRCLAGFSWAMVLAVCGIALLACEPDTAPECEATYRHALHLGKRNDDPALARRFVEACVASFDPKRLECIRAAYTAGEALACKPVRKRPG